MLLVVILTTITVCKARMCDRKIRAGRIGPRSLYGVTVILVTGKTRREQLLDYVIAANSRQVADVGV